MRCAVYEVLLPLMMMITAHIQTHTHTHTDTQKRKQYIRQFHSVHLADIKILKALGAARRCANVAARTPSR